MTIPLGLATALFALAVSPAAAAGDEHVHPHHAASAPLSVPDRQADAPSRPARGVTVKLTDVNLVDQQGRARRIRSDVLGDRITVVDFVYTSCTTVCPVVSAVFAQLQALLHEQQPGRLGADLALLTLTVDPLRDTPMRLKSYAEQIGAGPGWTWLTGTKPQVDEVLKAFGAYTPRFTDHPPLVMVGDPRTGQWQRFYGFATPAELAQAVAELSAARKHAAN